MYVHVRTNTHSVDQAIYLSIHRSIYLSIDPSIDPSIYRSIYLSIDLSIYRSIYRSIDLSIYLSIYRSIYLPQLYLISIRVSINLIRLSVDFSTYLSVLPISTYIAIYLPTYLFIFLSTYLVTYLSLCLSDHSFIHPSRHPSINFQSTTSLYLPIPACGGPHSARGKHAHAHYMRNRRYNVHCITDIMCTASQM